MYCPLRGICPVHMFFPYCMCLLHIPSQNNPVLHRATIFQKATVSRRQPRATVPEQNCLRATVPEQRARETILKRPSQSELSQNDRFKSDRPRATGKASTYKVKGSLEEWKGLLKDVCLSVLLYHVWGSSLPTSLSEDCWKENRVVASMYKSSILLTKRRRSST